MHNSPRLLSGVLALLFLAPASSMRAADPDFKEVVGLVRAHLPEAGSAEIQDASVDALFARFPGKLKWVDTGKTTNVSGVADSGFTRLVEGRYAYLRPSRFETSGEKLGAFLKSVSASNSISGGVLDLRFVSGRDCAAAVQMASLLVADRKPVLDCGDGVRSTEGNAVLGRVPWAVLVNRETRGTAEALAAALRQAGAAVLIGTRTAGQANVFEEYELKTGQRLAIATRAILAGDKQSIPASGVAPDVVVTVSPETERSAMMAFSGKPESVTAVQVTASSKPGTNAVASKTSRRRLNEAELVRMQREGRRSDPDSAGSASDTAATRGEDELADPVLSRGLDFVKALSVLRPKAAVE